MESAFRIASYSKDTSTKVGAVIAKDKDEISAGYNGPPPGMDDEMVYSMQRPRKYNFIIHAEVNAILRAQAKQAPVKGCVLYCPYYPCANCACQIITAGISEVVTLPFEIASKFHDRWCESMADASLLFAQCGIQVRYLDRSFFPEIGNSNVRSH